jgi:hypothetical protein
MWCVAELDDAYITQMEDVLALYEKPYNAAEPVVCLDEKPVALHADIRPPRPAKPGHIAKRDNEYKRCGTANLFAVVEPKAGPALHLRHAGSLRLPVRPGDSATGLRLSIRENHSSGHGQARAPDA